MIKKIPILLAVGTLFGLSSCDLNVDPADFERASTPVVEVYPNYTGTNEENGLDPIVDDVLIQFIDRAEESIDFAIMGFSRREVIDALVRAHQRGVHLRFVGDARYLEHHQFGYMTMDALNIPMMIGNMYHIMHDKFFVIDDKFTFTGTGNITPTGFDRNDNNYVYINSPHVAADFTAEFEQMLAGQFGTAKTWQHNGNLYEVGDTNVGVCFSPQEDCMGRILQGIDEANESIYFTIFAFTKDQVGEGFIRKHHEFEQYNACCDPADPPDDAQQAICDTQVVCQTPFRHREVRGVIDRSQLHSNGPYHEIYRLLLHGVNLRLDANNNSRLPGDYQAGGGRMHSKTMLMDAGTENGVILTGSFNWSSSATAANDETLIVLDGERVASDMIPYFERTWRQGTIIGSEIPLEERAQPGDIIFNEIHWDGWNGLIDPTDYSAVQDPVYNDEFIELYNTTDRVIDLSMFVIGTEEDFVTGIYPGTVIGPHERFLIVDHNIEPFDDSQPQWGLSAFQNADFVMNVANDVRFLRLNISNADLEMHLVDPFGNVIDSVGNGRTPFFGGRAVENNEIHNYSMERLHIEDENGIFHVGPGDDPASWARCEAAEGGANIREDFRAVIHATPGEPNANSPSPAAEPVGFREQQE